MSIIQYSFTNEDIYYFIIIITKDRKRYVCMCTYIKITNLKKKFSS